MRGVSWRVPPELWQGVGASHRVGCGRADPSVGPQAVTQMLITERPAGCGKGGGAPPRGGGGRADPPAGPKAVTQMLITERPAGCPFECGGGLQIPESMPGIYRGGQTVMHRACPEAAGVNRLCDGVR